MTDQTAPAPRPDTAESGETRFETADIPTLRRALLADADVHENRASAYADATTGPELAAWCGLLLAGSHNRMSSALLGLLSDPRVPADLAERGRYLVGQVLDGWPEVLDGANDDVPPASAAQVPGQQEIPAVLDYGCEACEAFPALADEIRRLRGELTAESLRADRAENARDQVGRRLESAQRELASVRLLAEQIKRYADWPGITDTATYPEVVESLRVCAAGLVRALNAGPRPGAPQRRAGGPSAAETGTQP